MPRSQKSPSASILEFFRTQELPIAELILDLAKGAIAERRQKSAQAKARAQASAAPAAPKAVPAPKAVAAKGTKAKGAKKKARAKRQTTVATPLAQASDSAAGISAPAGPPVEDVPAEAAAAASGR